MLNTLQNQDSELELLTVNKYDIIQSLTLEDVKNFLESLGVTRIDVHQDKQYLICPTICHNPLYEAESMKLYWYQNTKVFICYTECNEAMSIFRLYQKFMALNQHTVSDAEAEDYVKKCLKHIVQTTKTAVKRDDFDIEKYRFTATIPTLEEYPKEILSYFTQYYHPSWIKDGITEEVMKKFQIKFSIGQNKIIIPHFDIKGRLIGIRGRALNKKEVEEFGKYRPIQIGNTLYTHALQFNLYGVYEHKQGIQIRKSAIIAEAEKSVMLDDVYYGNLSNTVACCGLSFNKYHISMLTDILGANEIIIAFDKEYDDWRSEKAKKYRLKIEELCRRYKNQAAFSYIWDYDNVLNEKDSPFDKGKEVFEYLYKNRVKIR